MSAEAFSCPTEPRLDALAKRWHELETGHPAPGLSRAEHEARTDELADAANDVAVEIADTPASTVAGALLKLLISDEMGGHSDDDAPGRLILRAIDDLKRLA